MAIGNHINIEFLGSGLWLVILLCGALLALTYFYYRRTTPPVGYLRWVLMALRGIAFIALFLALAQPVLIYSESSWLKKRAALLLDCSASMNLPLTNRSEETRFDRARELIADPGLSDMWDELSVDRFYYAESLYTETENISPRGHKSNPGKALRQLQKTSRLNRYDYVFLVSDGRITEGENLPDIAAQSGSPLYTIAVGDSSRNDDILLTDVNYDDVIFSGRETEIEVTLSQKGNLGIRSQLRISEGARVLAQKLITLPGDGKSGQYPLTFTPPQPGRHILDVELVPVDEESNRLNNRRKISIRVLKSKLRVLLYSSSLNQEQAFLNRYLNSRDDLEVERVIDAAGGTRLGVRFPKTQEKLNSYDVVIMIDPDLSRLSAGYDRLVSYLSDRGGGLLVFMGEKYARSAPGIRLEKLIPLAVSPRGEKPVEYGKFQLVPDQRMIFHPTIKLAENREEILSLWSSQPPFSSILSVDSVRSSGVALAYAETGRPRELIPGMALRRMGPGKILAVAVSPFWHWAMLPVGVGGESAGYKNFISGSIRWLTIGDESDRISFKPTSEVFQNGEEIAFAGSAHDEGFRPIENGTGDLIVVSQANDTTRARIVPDPEKAGRYLARAGVLPPGKYSYIAELSSESLRLGRFRGEFAVDDINRETAFGDVDWNSLSRTAQNSGAVFVSYKNIQPLIDAVDTEKIEITERHEYRLWNNLIVLLIIVGMLSIEWFIRKRRQLL